MSARPWLWGGICCLVFAACELPASFFPRSLDGGQEHVPLGYRSARGSEGHRAHLALTGAEQLSCHDCHRIADAGFTATAVEPCATCHAPQQRQHHPFDGGVPMTCTTCHAFRSVAEPLALDKWGCRGCHVERPDGGVVTGPLVGAVNPSRLPPHVTVHTAKCEACHRPHGAPFTRAADCGGCHEVTASHGRGEKALSTETCMTCHEHHRPAADAAARCSECHRSATVPAKARVGPEALFPHGHEACTTCHRPHAFVATQVADCEGCHRQKPVLAAQSHERCTSCHRPHEPRAAPVACESCHRDAHVAHPADAAGRTCTGCHPVHDPPSVVTAGFARSPAIAVSCTSCHSGPPFDSGHAHAESLNCRSCHQQPHTGKPARAGLCQTCHRDEFALSAKNAGHRACESCHAGLPHAEAASPKGCLSCHQKVSMAQSAHGANLECGSCHEAHSGKPVATCVSCHSTDEHRPQGLHRVQEHQACATCHAPHGKQPGADPKTCRSCHIRLPAESHSTFPQQCVSCHLFTDAAP